MDSSSGNSQNFATLSEALSSLGIHGNEIDLHVIERGRAYKVDSNEYDLQYLGAADANAVDHGKLCNCCAKINAEDVASVDGYKHSTYEQLSASAANCFLCASIKQMIGEFVRSQGLSSNSSISLRLVRAGSGGVLSGTALAVFVGGQQIPGARAKFYVRCFQGDPAEKFGISTVSRLTSTSSRESLEVASEWYQSCLKYHECGRSYPLVQDLTDAPARLLHLRHHDSGQFPEVKLLMCDPNAFDEPYATLSHCWGKASSEKWITTKQNLKERYARVLTSELPNTFLDAIRICAHLRIHYLWIDSICIVQDDKEDWRKEAAKMGSIYANSHLTIAADFGEDLSKGIFNTVSVTQLKDIEDITEIQTPAENGTSSTLLIYPFQFGTGDRIDEIENSILSTRGWTYQERLLSPRILHFTEKQLFWECRQCYLAEDGITNWQPDKIRTVPSIVQDIGAKGAIVGLEEIVSQPEKERGILLRRLIDFWYTTVVARNYSNRSLTFGADKLPAISGVARAIGKLMVSQYYAGHWELGFGSTLVWVRKIGIKSLKRPSSGGIRYRAPSWSWAAVDFPVDWPGGVLQPEDECQITLTRANLKYPSSDQYGQIESGTIMISGRIGQFEMQYVPPRDPSVSDREDVRLMLSNVPVGWAYLDYDEHPTKLNALLCVTARSPRGVLGYVLLLERSSTVPGAYERKGAGIIGVNAPGTFQTPGVKEISAYCLQLLLKVPLVTIPIV